MNTKLFFNPCLDEEERIRSSASIHTTSGHPCIFPFFYKRDEFTSCTTSSLSSSKDTALDSPGNQGSNMREILYSRKAGLQLREGQFGDFSRVVSQPSPSEAAWCAVAVDNEGVVTMKSECVGSLAEGKEP